MNNIQFNKDKSVKKNKHDNRDKLLCLSAPITPNGKVHLGHLAGPYLAADVMKRFYLMLGKEIVHHTGTDDHQTYLASLAKTRHVDAKSLVKENCAKIVLAYNHSEINIDDFCSPLDNTAYQVFVKKLFNTLVESNHLIKQNAALPYCEQCNHFLLEADVAGICLNCNQAMSGHDCEYCFNVISHHHDESSKATCTACGGNASWKLSIGYFLDLKSFQQPLAVYLKSTHMNEQLRENANYNLTQLKPFRVTYPANWGIDVPITDMAGHKIHVWFEMAANTLFQSKAGFANVQFFGMDNAFYYTILNAAILIAAKEHQALPVSFISNSMYLLNNKKFSTSENYALWVDEFSLKTNSSMLRFYLGFNRSELCQNNFKESEFNQFCNYYLGGMLSRWLNNINCRHLKNTTPTLEIMQLDESGQQHYQWMVQQIARIKEHYYYTNFSLSAATHLIVQFIVHCYHHFLSLNNSPLELISIKTLAMIVTPIMPAFSQMVASNLACDLTHWENEPMLTALSLKAPLNSDFFKLSTSLSRQYHVA